MCVESTVEPQSHAGLTEDGPRPLFVFEREVSKLAHPFPCPTLALVLGSLEAIYPAVPHVLSLPQEWCGDTCAEGTGQEVSLT